VGRHGRRSSLVTKTNFIPSIGFSIFLSIRVTGTPASAYTTRSSPLSRRSDSTAAQHRPVGSTRSVRRTPCHFAWCHPGRRKAVPPRDIERGLPGR
jgi:hypothetical protein